MTELVVLAYAFQDARVAVDTRGPSVASSMGRMGTVLDALWFEWPSDGRLAVHIVELPASATSTSGLCVGLLDALLNDSARRGGLVRADTSKEALDELARLAFASVPTSSVALLRQFIEDAPQGLLLVVRPHPAVAGEPLVDGTRAMELRIDGDVDELVAAARAVSAGVVTPHPLIGSSDREADDPIEGALQRAEHRTVIVPDLRSVWRSGLIVLGLVLLYLAGAFVVSDAGLLIFQLVMAWLASIAMEPAVRRLAQHMKRGLATGAVMVGVVASSILFFLAFGNLLVQQVANLATALPGAVQAMTEWANSTFGLSLDPEALASKLQVSPSQVASIGAEVAGGVLGFVAQLLGGVFSMFTIGLFIFYFSADAPRLRRWIARLLPPRHQEVFVVVWDLAVQKTGGYVAARIVLAGICGAFTSAFLALIGMDYWLALGVWTGVVSQFVPTIGTYIAIALPVVVGLTSEQPVDGVLALAFALVYQQIENLTIEPKISADAVDMHPAVAFASVLLGAALFGVGGALVAVPVAALGLALFDIYSRTYDLLPQLAATPRVTAPGRARRRHGLALPRRHR